MRPLVTPGPPGRDVPPVRCGAASRELTTGADVQVVAWPRVPASFSWWEGKNDWPQNVEQQRNFKKYLLKIG